MRVIRDTRPVARKIHRCDACDAWIEAGYTSEDVTAEQWAVVEKAHADNWRIHPGQQYRAQVQERDGELLTFRGRLDMTDLAGELELWDDCY